MPQVVLSDKKDTSGQAQVRRRVPPSCTATTAAPIDAGLQPMAPVSVQEAGAEEICTDTTTEVEVIPPARQSRTTEWRRRKALAAQMVLGETPLKIRKERCCRLCGKPIGTEGHSQFHGKIYCPFVPGQIPRKEWLALQQQQQQQQQPHQPSQQQ